MTCSLQLPPARVCLVTGPRQSACDWTHFLPPLLVCTIHKVMFAKIIKSVYKMLSELQNFLFWTEMKLNDKRLLQRQHIIQPHYYCVCTIQLRLFISYHTYEIDSDWPQPSPEYHSPCRGACCPRFTLATRIFKKKRTYISTYHTHTWVAHVYRHPLINWIVTRVPVPVQTQLIPRSLARENFRKVRK